MIKMNGKYLNPLRYPKNTQLLINEISQTCVRCGAHCNTMTTRRVAIITGGTKGIGRGISEALAEDGFDLVLNYNSDEAAATKMVAEMSDRYPEVQCTLVGGDISLNETRSAIFTAFDEMSVSHELGVVVHNAGQYLGMTSTNTRDLDGPPQRVLGHGAKDGMDLRHIEYYQAMYGNAFIDLCERGIARMKSDTGGALIGISSPGCNVTFAVRSGYAMPGSGKCVMEHACRSIAMTAGAKNINCNVVIPGYTLSNAWGKVADHMGTTVDALMSKGVSAKAAIKRPATSRELGDVVAFLCSPKGRYITGVALPVDGGNHLS